MIEIEYNVPLNGSHHRRQRRHENRFRELKAIDALLFLVLLPPQLFARNMHKSSKDQLLSKTVWTLWDVLGLVCFSCLSCWCVDPSRSRVGIRGLSPSLSAHLVQ